MYEFQAARTETGSEWDMPLSSEPYDRGVLLSKEEREALIEVANHLYLFRGHQLAARFARLTRPLQDAFELKQIQKTGGKYNAYLRVMYHHMVRTDQSFWGWSQDEWATTLFSPEPAPYSGVNGVPIALRLAAYLFGGFLIVGRDDTSPYDA